MVAEGFVGVGGGEEISESGADSVEQSRGSEGESGGISSVVSGRLKEICH